MALFGGTAQYCGVSQVTLDLQPGVCVACWYAYSNTYIANAILEPFLSSQNLHAGWLRCIRQRRTKDND
jgi:hypothetical protein